jgi:uncharacterized Tic20 family protein
MTNMNNVPGPGEPQGPPSVPPIIEPGQAGRETNRDARMWAMFCHLAALATFVIPAIGLVIGPLVVWMIKKEQYPFVDEQGKEAVNFQISMLIYVAVGALLVLACGIGFIVISVVGILDLVFMIIGAIKANDGYHYRYPYPLSIRFIK